MGKKSKITVKNNVFKVVGAKSLKKTKAKAVNLGLKNIKQKIQDIDKDFLELTKRPKPNPNVSKPIEIKPQQKKNEKVSTQEIANAVNGINKMDL